MVFKRRVTLLLIALMVVMRAMQPVVRERLVVWQLMDVQERLALVVQTLAAAARCFKPVIWPIRATVV